MQKQLLKIEKNNTRDFYLIVAALLLGFRNEMSLVASIALVNTKIVQQIISMLSDPKLLAIEDLPEDFTNHEIVPNDGRRVLITAAAVGLLSSLLRSMHMYHLTGMSYDRSMRRSLKDNIFRFKRIATTETFTAYSDQISYSCLKNPSDEYVKQWNAVLDARTCDRCSGLDGERVPLGQSFSAGEPSLHYNCRCTIEIVRI
jgi:SPP1 gp7 family putative phage head morphogenesis protein